MNWPRGRVPCFYCFHFLEFGKLITVRKRSLGQGNVLTPVCHSIHRGLGLASQHASQITGRHPLGRHLEADSPLGRHPPRQTTPGGRHPSPPQDYHWSGRCISYWNAFLYWKTFEQAAVRLISFLFCFSTFNFVGKGNFLVQWQLPKDTPHS